MPLKRGEKEQIVAEMSARLRSAEAVVVTDYRGLNVAQIARLRGLLRAAGSDFQVIKNTLAQRAFEAAGLEAPADLLSGPTAIAVFGEDVSAPAKALAAFAKESGILAIKGGLLAGRALDAAAVGALADLPTREELFSQLVGLFTAPPQQLVTVLSAPLRDFVNVLSARVEAG